MRTGPGEASNVATGGSPPTTRSPSAPRRGYTRWMVPSAIAVAYGLFAVAVHLRMLDDLDIAVRHLAAPDGVWGSSEDRAESVYSRRRWPFGLDDSSARRTSVRAMPKYVDADAEPPSSNR